MRIASALQVLALWAGLVLSQNLTTGSLGNATVVTNNPISKEASGTLPEQPFFKDGSLDGNVKGTIIVKSSPNGIGVEYSVFFSNLPKEGGPFLFHVHEHVVPEDGNCTSTLAHLDPTLRGEDSPCNSTFPQTCQVGDLSGKYGKITSDPYEAVFHDEFGSMNTDNNASVPDRSFVVHFANKTRISCANFTISNGSTSYSMPNASSTASSSGSTGVHETNTVPPTSSVPAGGTVGLNAQTIFQTVASVALVAAFLTI